jgi:hypothetical protein
MEIFGVFIALIVMMAAAKEIIPAVARMLDGILLAVIRAPFRWLFRSGSLTPYQRGLRRASTGAFLLVSSIAAATWFPVFLGGQSVFDLIAAFARSPTDFPGAAVWVAALLVGLILLVIGLRQARGGDRDPMSAIVAAVIGGGCIAALWFHLFPSPDWTFATLLEIAALKTLYIATAAAGLVRLWLTMPLPNPAMAAVNRVLRERNSPMVGARRRR